MTLENVDSALDFFGNTPQRVRQKHSTAEEPVTARIRRRTKAIAAPDPTIESDPAALPIGTSPPPESTAQDSAIKPQVTFQERLAMEREGKDRKPSVS